MSELQSKKTLFIADDDASVLDALNTVFSLEGFEVKTFLDGDLLLNHMQNQKPNAVLLDVHMPKRSGLDVLKNLHEQDKDLPIFMISGQGDIPMAVESVKNGALDFIEKPFNAQTVVSAIVDGIAAREAQINSPKATYHFAGADLLTPRECEVLGLIANGQSNKEAGRKLGISPRTIEVHRARIMEKIGAKNTADLVRLVFSQAS